jgi:hypothetical protein
VALEARNARDALTGQNYDLLVMTLQTPIPDAPEASRSPSANRSRVWARQASFTGVAVA